MTTSDMGICLKYEFASSIGLVFQPSITRRDAINPVHLSDGARLRHRKRVHPTDNVEMTNGGASPHREVARCDDRASDPRRRVNSITKETLERRTVGVAHKTLPCGSRVVVRYKGRFLRTKVIDRGPYANHAKWDLTRRAARLVGFEYTDEIRVAKLRQGR